MAIKYFSTNHTAAEVTFGEALLQGLAPDKGLYMPNAIPTFTKDELNALKGKQYYEIAATVFSKFLGDEVSFEELQAMTKDAYNFDVPLEKVIDRKYVMRLDQGPTASFKDFAGRMMGRMMQYFLKRQNVNKLILTATSGDTGSAMAHAFYGLNNIQIAVLFPEKEVSDRQRKQMTTLQKNVQIIAIDGKFDDAQAMVKQAFSDPELTSLNFTSANSINIGRLIPQIVYYIYSYMQLRKQDSDELENVVFCIPSGNFGDMMGCVLAMKMGLPVSKILVATNENDEFSKLMKTHKYNKIEPSKNCLSSAMNVGHPSNLARLSPPTTSPLRCVTKSLWHKALPMPKLVRQSNLRGTNIMLCWNLTVQLDGSVWKISSLKMQLPRINFSFPWRRRILQNSRMP